MVERPIKKSERQAKADAGESAETSSPISPPRESRGGDRPSKGKGKGKGKGKRDDRSEEPKQVVNPAFARPPKPPKAKPVEEIAPVGEETQASPEEAVDSGDVSEETKEPVLEAVAEAT